jgi:tRNA threonylcarbamoyladenosine biosynthesis protein TsaB
MIQQPLVLSVDTSSRVGSVALAIGGKLLGETVFSSPLKHSMEVFPAISGLLGEFGGKPSDIGQIYISIGPGSFTGLRIATTIAKLMNLANAVKIVTISTLDVIAANISSHANRTHAPRACRSDSAGVSGSKDTRVHESVNKMAAILDAKRGQFFIAVYERNSSNGHQVHINNSWKKILPDSIMTSPEFLDQFAHGENPVWLLGDGLLYYSDKFQSEGTCFLEQKYWSPRAANVHKLGWEMARIGRFAEPISMTPAYMSRPDAKIKSR